MKPKARKTRARIAQGNTAFALDLYDKLKTEEGNLFFSPFSISAALAMTYAGAAGDTARQMREVLHAPKVPEDLYTGFKDLIQEIEQIQEWTGVQLATANSLWPHSGYPLLESFIRIVEEYYRAGIFPVDYEIACEAARNRINRWVEESTNGKFADILSPGSLDAETRLVLVNAIYFKGTWMDQFPESATRDEEFYIQPEAPVRVPMMYQSEYLGYAETEEDQLLDLSYHGAGLSMVVLLPRERDGLPRLEQSLTPESLKNRLKDLRPREVEAHLPRFRLDWGCSLNTYLASMGMVDAFDVDKADLSGISREPKGLYISEIVHKAFVAVNEKGTEAAAATVVEAYGACAEPDMSEPPEFRADHPFLFLIRERSTRSILFMGRVTDPTEGGV